MKKIITLTLLLVVATSYGQSTGLGIQFGKPLAGLSVNHYLSESSSIQAVFSPNSIGALGVTYTFNQFTGRYLHHIDQGNVATPYLYGEAGGVFFSYSDGWGTDISTFIPRIGVGGGVEWLVGKSENFGIMLDLGLQRTFWNEETLGLSFSNTGLALGLGVHYYL
ncbi:hypothetical protein N9B83_00570 [Schleiferiaceae bacterium]|nr:hypothetical protein [Schleiferiaceae bacterium]